MMNLRPINNIVDITNYIMYETGIPLHAFDYDEIKGKEINVVQAKGGEDFTSVDNLSYRLPEGAIIIKDKERIIDLCGIKGGINSGIKKNTKTVYLQSTADNPTKIRKTTQKLALRSDASSIFERGVDPGSTLDSLKRATKLVLELTSGSIASKIIDLKERDFLPRKLNLRMQKLDKILGIHISTEEVIRILDSLSFNPYLKGSEIQVTVPTYRQDIKIEEDLIEETARIYGYNKFPLTLPEGKFPTRIIPYNKNFDIENIIKNFLQGSSFSEIYSYSLVSKDKIQKVNFDPNTCIKILNPVSLDYEYLRPTLVCGLIDAVKMNETNFDSINLFEIGKVYYKADKNSESTELCFISNTQKFIEIKGRIEDLLQRIGVSHIEFQPIDQKTLNRYPYFSEVRTASIVNKGKHIGILGFINKKTSEIFNLKSNPIIGQFFMNTLPQKAVYCKFQPISQYPFIIEDLSLVIDSHTYIGKVINEIKNTSELVYDIALIDSYEKSKTFRIRYRNTKKTLSNSEIKKVRNDILNSLNKKFGIRLKLKE